MNEDTLSKRMERLKMSQPTRLAQNTDEIPTSAHTLLSSLHGRDRRKLRKIGKRDLQAAVKYGIREETYPHPKTGEMRYKFTYANIVYITDSTYRNEVTSWVEPIEIREAYVTATDIDIHNKLTEKFRIDPSMITSHSVFIVDQSASMNGHDVEDYKSRSDAVFGTLALDFVGKRIDDGQLQHTDCASLILMRDTSEVVINREPMDNVFFNKLLHQMKKKPSSHGNYLPALSLAEKLLGPDMNDTNGGAVMLFFLSDGRPSDYNPRSWSQTYTFNNKIDTQIANIAKPLSDRLTFGAIGYANDSLQFGVLEDMTKKFLSHNVKEATFHHAKGDSTSLSVTVSNLSSSLMQSKTATVRNDTSSSRTVRDLQKGDFNQAALRDMNNWNVYDKRKGFHQLQKWSFRETTNDWSEEKFDNDTVAMAITKSHFANGCERIVYHLRECKEDGGKLVFRDGKFVAKECRYIEDEATKEVFHKLFARTHLKAQRLAEKFNTVILENKKRHPYLVVASISFLKCWFYSFYESQYDYGRNYLRGILVENYLDHTKYKKWNSNNGHVDGRKVSVNDILNADKTIQNNLGLDMILEECSEEENSDSDDLGSDYTALNSVRYNVTIDDYPQTFSHFSYRYTQRNKLVCDLQGVLDSSKKPPLFQLTDPVIHSSKKGKDKRFGRTDCGETGINKFFKTHDCNDLCRLLGIDGFHPYKR